MRIVEAYVGEYASGKSENAVNRALFLAKKGRPVTLVDLDLVEPCYTLRPLKETLVNQGVEVVAWETKDMIGLGETGSLLHPSMRWVLHRSGDIILDIGYGVHGAKVLNLLEGAHGHPDLKIYAVINLGRSMTSTKEEVIDYLKDLGQVDGLVNNSHLGEETTEEFILNSIRIMEEVSKLMDIPLIAISMTEEMAAKMDFLKQSNIPLWVLKRYMPESFW